MYLIFFVVPVKHGTPTLDELEELGAEIVEKWIKPGRRQLSQKGYQMLRRWRQKEGSAATYQALCDGLKHKLVQRWDLAEKFCHVDGNYFLQYKSNVGTLV